MKRQRSVEKFQDEDAAFLELKILKKKSKKDFNSKNGQVNNKKQEKKELKKQPSKKNISKPNLRSMSKVNKRSKSSADIKHKKLELEGKNKYDPKIEKAESTLSLKFDSLSFKSNLGPLRIRLGLCCLNNLLRAQKDSVFCDRRCTLSTYRSKGKTEAIDRGLKNVQDIEKLILWNKEHFIEVLRISSELFPHYSNIRNIDEKDRYSLSHFEKELKKAGALAKKLNHRMTFHPGQFNVVGSPHEQVFKSTIEDLKMHADIMDIMGLDEHSIMVVHGGGTYGNKKDTIHRWIQNFKKLPDNVKKRLVLENCEKNFSVIDCLEVSKEIGIPVVFDNHHYECYKLYHPEEKFDDIRIYIKACIETWVKRGIRPKFHISEQSDSKSIIGAHSDYVETFPEYYLEIPEKYNIGVDVMVEAKAKEAAIMYLYKKYKKEFLSHIEKIDDRFLEVDRENKMAKFCPACKIN